MVTTGNYRLRNRVERFFNKLKQFRHIATRYERLAANYLTMIKIATIRIWLRASKLMKNDLDRSSE